jgi:hypothetical protein
LASMEIPRVCVAPARLACLTFMPSCDAEPSTASAGDAPPPTRWQQRSVGARSQRPACRRLPLPGPMFATRGPLARPSRLRAMVPASAGELWLVGYRALRDVPRRSDVRVPAGGGEAQGRGGRLDHRRGSSTSRRVTTSDSMIPARSTPRLLAPAIVPL